MKRFLLGVGCQKGGTTWLHDYLAGHPQCDMGFQKEYHIFDGLDLPDLKAFRGNTRRKISQIRQQYGLGPRRMNPDQTGQGVLPPAVQREYDRAVLRDSFYRDLNTYADYFRDLAAPDPIRLVGDITPSYAGLGAERLAGVRALLEARGFQVAVVFLMRDPVDRLYSAVRMELRERQRQGKGGNQSASALLRQRYAKPNNEMRTRYDTTIAALETAFDPGQIHYGFYETLFSDSELQRLTGFLGIEARPADFGARINASPRDEVLDPDVAAEVRRHYAATYDRCMEKFGADFLRGIWPHA